MEWVRIKEYRGWFKRPVEFKVFPNDRLTKIPIDQPKRFSFLYLLWLKYAPKIWKDYRRHRSHMQFLDKRAFPKDANLRRTFGTVDYIEGEKARVMRLPPIELNDFDTRIRSSNERRESFRRLMREAFVEAKNKVKE